MEQKASLKSNERIVPSPVPISCSVSRNWFTPRILINSFIMLTSLWQLNWTLGRTFWLIICFHLFVQTLPLPKLLSIFILVSLWFFSYKFDRLFLFIIVNIPQLSNKPQFHDSWWNQETYCKDSYNLATSKKLKWNGK